MSMTDPDPRQGEIWLVDFNPTKGAEISKIRPAVVVNDDAVGRLPLRIVVPVTDWKERFSSSPWFTELPTSDSNGLSKHSGADGFQVKSVSCYRFNKKLGTVSAVQLQDIHYTILFCLGK